MSRRILVVDDTDANRYAVARTLRHAGWIVEETTCGEDALARAHHSSRPDVMVIDVMLPDLDGIAVCRRLKADPATASILVLNTSATLTRSRDRASGLDSGADAYLSQPIDPLELTATVRSLLRIRDMEDELRRSNHELELFAHAAAHDLREPLRMIANYVGLFQRRYGTVLDATQRDWFTHIAGGAKRMGRLIDMLLDFARVNAMPIGDEQVDTARAVIDAMTNLEVQVRETHAAVEVVEGLPTVPGDATQITQVFQNLIANALKYHGDEPPRVRVAADASDRAWRFTIADNGIGIAPEHRDRLFGLFQRLHQDRTGSGLGLSLCKRIIDRHGGTIGVDSEPGRGSTFWFTLPATRR